MGEVAAERIVEEPAPEMQAGVDCEGFMASIAHNVLKAARRLGSGTGPPEDQLKLQVQVPMLSCTRSSMVGS